MTKFVFCHKSSAKCFSAGLVVTKACALGCSKPSETTTKLWTAIAFTVVHGKIAAEKLSELQFGRLHDEMKACFWSTAIRGGAGGGGGQSGEGHACVERSVFRL